VVEVCSELNDRYLFWQEEHLACKKITVSVNPRRFCVKLVKGEELRNKQLVDPALMVSAAW